MTQSDRRLLSIAFLSLGLLSNFGSLSVTALACVIVSLGLCIQSLSPKPWGPPLPRRAAVALLVVLAASSLHYFDKFGGPLVVFVATFALLVAAIIIHTVVATRAATVVAFVLATISTVTAILANITWGFLDQDVFHFQQDAAQALLHGQNPYSPLVASPNIVPPGVPAWLQLHLPYGPILPVLEAPFRILGDVRILHVVAALVTSLAVLALARRAGTLDRTAGLVMAFPLTIGMVIFSWIDVITMAGLAVWLVSFRSHPRIATCALVVALGAKPTTLIALVPIFFWSIRARRQVIIATVVTALFVLPFALITGVSQFYYNVLGVQLDVLPRLDSLTLNSFLNSIHLPILPFAISACVIAVATILVLRRRPASYGDLLTGTAILATVSFLVAKWAFFNYYYIPAVLLLLAIAGNNLAVDVPEMISPPALLLRSVEWLRGAARRVPRRRATFPSPTRAHGPAAEAVLRDRRVIDR
jgi:hypothetical protein